jgi:hypothetical protein
VAEEVVQEWHHQLLPAYGTHPTLWDCVTPVTNARDSTRNTRGGIRVMPKRDGGFHHTLEGRMLLDDHSR